MSILSGPAIRAAVERGDIVIDPFRPEHVNPASVDFTLGDKVIEYRPNVEFDCKVPTNHLGSFFEMKKYGGSYQILPGRLYLMHTVERVRTDCYVSVLDGKSSIGRLGVQIHMTAGYGDPGFDGQYTLEVTAVYPTRVYAGMRFCQMRFHELSTAMNTPGTYSEVELYKGNYTSEASMGPVPSRSWKQFERKE